MQGFYLLWYFFFLNGHSLHGNHYNRYCFQSSFLIENLKHNLHRNFEIFTFTFKNLSLSSKSITRTLKKCKTSFAKLPCISPWSSSKFYKILKNNNIWARSQILQSCGALFKTCYPPDKSHWLFSGKVWTGFYPLVFCSSMKSSKMFRYI